MHVLLCGHRSFAAKGLIEHLRAAGHQVTTFSRGPLLVRTPTDANASGDDAAVHVTGPALEIDQNPHLAGPFDVVVNYILLKDEPVAPNVEFTAALLRLCRRCGVRHLVHISSISSYKSRVRLVTEDAPIEEVPEKKGSYGSLKVATDQYLLANRPPELKLSLVRPGFILGPGVPNPIVGTAARLPWGTLLVIGSGKSIIPMTTRGIVNRAVTKLVSEPPAESVEVIVLAAPNSPSRMTFLEACCRRMGTGTKARSLPVALWWMIAIGAEAALRVLGQGKLKPFSKLTARTPRQRFDASRSQKRLGIELTCDWETELVGSLERQSPNFALPAAASPLKQLANAARKISFIGFGRIVRQKHLPGLSKAGFTGEIEAYDLRPSPALSAQEPEVRAIEGAVLSPSDLFVVASPGPAHAKAISPLSNVAGPIVVEKPLCYRPDELDQWLAFATGRRDGVYVCHNYRFKQNVQRMLQHLARYNPGPLDHVSLEFQSPPATNDSAAWLRDERRARTLLMDYSIHFLDVACMFGGTTPWNTIDVRHGLNAAGQTASITGRLAGLYSVDFHLRQGFAPRRARLRFQFQNYVASLGFFPDTFVPHHSDDNPWLHKAESKESRRQTVRKVADKLTGRDSDTSHALTLAMAAASPGETAARQALSGLTVASMAPFYRALLDVAERVYGGPFPGHD